MQPEKNAEYDYTQSMRYQRLCDATGWKPDTRAPPLVVDSLPLKAAPIPSHVIRSIPEGACDYTQSTRYQQLCDRIGVEPDTYTPLLGKVNPVQRRASALIRYVTKECLTKTLDRPMRTSIQNVVMAFRYALAKFEMYDLPDVRSEVLRAGQKIEGVVADFRGRMSRKYAFKILIRVER